MVMHSPRKGRKRIQAPLPAPFTEQELIALELRQDRAEEALNVFDMLPKPLRDFANYKDVEPIIVAAEYHKAGHDVAAALRRLTRHLGPIDMKRI